MKPLRAEVTAALKAIDLGGRSEVRSGEEDLEVVQEGRFG